jgi:hypothetical protein
MLRLGIQEKGEQIPRAPRNDCEQRVTVQDGMARHFGLLLNVSGSGGLLQTDCSRKIGDKVLILLRVRNNDQKICHVVINARVTRELKDGGRKNNYGIEWIDASCDNEPATLKFLIENLLLGATGRIKVDRNREVSSKALYTFVFASRKAITDYAIKKFIAQENNSRRAQVEEPPLNAGPSTSRQEKEATQEAEAEMSDKKAVAPPEESEMKTKGEEAPETPEERNPLTRVEESEAPKERTPFVMGGPEANESEAPKERTPFVMGGETLDKTDENNDEHSLSHSTPADDVTTGSSEGVQEALAPPGAPVSTKNQKEKDPVIKEPSSSGKSTNKNRRQEKRAQIYGITCSFVIRGTEYRGSIRNISRAGALLSSNDAYPTNGSLLTLKLKKGNESRSTRVNATVIRESKNCRQKNTFAVRFLPTTHRGHARDIQKFFDKIFKPTNS